MAYHLDLLLYDRRAHAKLLTEARMGTGRDAGTVMVPVPPDARAVNSRIHARRYVTSTAFSSAPLGGVDPLLEGIRDAADECVHGSLPTDRSIGCGCWGLRAVAPPAIEFASVAA